MLPLSLDGSTIHKPNDGMRYTNSVIPTPIQQPPCVPRELVASPVFLLGRLGFTVKKHAMQELEDAGFSGYDYGLLAFLAERPGETQATIADSLRLDRSQLVGLLDALEERALIERRVQHDPLMIVVDQCSPSSGQTPQSELLQQTSMRCRRSSGML